ncbi:MAG: DUF934 domain-containing protein [Gammaproteobacteria bacterium]|nr:DUF934 domain-containing protein [Gammaproteobacteria bacterium]
MPVLINNRQQIEDSWIRLIDDQIIEDQSHIIVSLYRLIRDWSQLQLLEIAIGVELESDAVVEDMLFALSEIDMVVLHFEVFADGRAFSQAKLLRERYGFSGDIRARGDVIRDQLAFMRRCGFSQFEVGDDENIELAFLAFNEISSAYQSDLNRIA